MIEWILQALWWEGAAGIAIAAAYIGIRHVIGGRKEKGPRP